MSEAPTAATPPLASAPTDKSFLPLLSLIFAGVALLLAFVASAVAWLPAVVAIVLAIIALARKARPRLLAVLAIIIAPIAIIIAIVVTVAVVVAGVEAGIDAINDPPAVESADDSSEEEAADDGIATLGETVTNADGVSVTFQSVTCGIATAGPQFFEETAKGQFCEVRYNVQNGSDEKVDLYASDIKGEIGTATYDSNTTISTFAGEMFTTALNPGLGADAIAYIDIPVGAVLDYVVYDPMWSFLTAELRVRAA